LTEGVQNDASIKPPQLTLTMCDLDLLTPKADTFMPLPMDHLCQFAAKSAYSFCKYCGHKSHLFWPPVTYDPQSRSFISLPHRPIHAN